jgi:hypothetical protein
MERIFLLYLLSCITFSLKAQDYKVKKGELQIEGTPVAKLEKKEGKYEFSDLSGNFMYKAVLTEKTAQNNRAPHRWVELTGNNGKVREIPLPDKLKFTFSGEKAIVDNMLKSNTGLLTVKGIDPEVVKTFFSTEDRQFSNKWDPIFERVKSEIKAEDKLEESDRITIKEGGIFKKEKRIGSYTKKTNPLGGSVTAYDFAFYDVKDEFIASSKFTSMVDSEYYNIQTFDGKTLPVFVPLIGFSSDLEKRLVMKLYANGYPFGDMAPYFAQYEEDKKNAQDAAQQERIAQARKQSINFYDVEGYVLDPQGNKLNGLITIEFESIEAILNKNIIIAITETNQVKLKRDGTETIYNAADNVVFGVGDRTFLGTHSGREVSYIFKVEDSTNIHFYEILYTNNGNYVLSHPKMPEAYLIKIGSKPALYVGDKDSFRRIKTPEEVQKLVSDYLQCPAINPADYNTTNKESLIALINDYTAKCK